MKVTGWIKVEHATGLTIFGYDDHFLSIFESQIKMLKLASGGQRLL
jgi:hypothetical protein